MIEIVDFYPETLKALPIWVLWKHEMQKSRMTKVPYQASGRRASATDPGTWTTYAEAVAAWKQKPDAFNGLGTVMSKQYRTIFIDIDHCIDPAGSYDKRAVDILEAFTDDNGSLMTFVEVSQSGTGLHLIVTGDIPRSFKNSKANVEMYADGRFVAMTGRAVSPREPVECDDGVRYVFERYKTECKLSESVPVPVSPSMRNDDEWIIRHATERNGSKFSALFSGNWTAYGSQSEADIALCYLLAFWTNNDPAAIDRLFRRSGLYRAKWERANYRDTTIRKAIAHNDETFFEWTRRQITERGNASLEDLYL